MMTYIMLIFCFALSYLLGFRRGMEHMKKETPAPNREYSYKRFKKIHN